MSKTKVFAMRQVLNLLDILGWVAMTAMLFMVSLVPLLGAIVIVDQFYERSREKRELLTKRQKVGLLTILIGLQTVFWVQIFSGF